MLKLVQFTSNSDNPIWINPALVRTVHQSGPIVILVFGDDHKVGVAGDAASVVAQLTA